MLAPATCTFTWSCWSSNPKCVLSPMICFSQFSSFQNICPNRRWIYLGTWKATGGLKTFLSKISKYFYSSRWKYFCEGPRNISLHQDESISVKNLKIFLSIKWKYFFEGPALKTAVTQHPLLSPLLPLVRWDTQRYKFPSNLKYVKRSNNLRSAHMFKSN